ncbi:MAG: TIM barrel protein [Chitinivibrionales bacterium]|nr:TIM barrel protein [Chitinivibrionales bacterium]
MSDWPVGLSTGCFYTKSIFDCIDSIIESGFNMIEVCSSPNHLDYHNEAAVQEAARMLDDKHVETYSFHAPFSENIDITSLNDHEREHAFNEISRAAQAAATLNVRYFVLHPGPEKTYNVPAHERMQRMRNAAEVLDRISERCSSLGVGVVLENMLPHLFCGDISEMVWLLGSINSVIPGACLDTGHAYLSGNLHHVMYKLSGLLLMIHANDNKGNRDDHLPPGRGGIEWKRLLWELGRTGFHGGIILEVAGDERMDPDKLLHGAREARLYLRRIMQELALASPPAVAFGSFEKVPAE